MCLVRLLCEHFANKLVKFLVLAYLLAWLLSFTSPAPYLNFPIAAILVFCVHYLSTRLVLQSSLPEYEEGHRGRRFRKFHEPVRSDFYYVEKPRQPLNKDLWKRLVNAPIVESAWETFCGSIVQEVVTLSHFS